MKDLLTQIANINSYSYNVEGLSKVKELLKSWYQNFENNCPKLKLKYEEFDLKPQKYSTNFRSEGKKSILDQK